MRVEFVWCKVCGLGFGTSERGLGHRVMEACVSKGFRTNSTRRLFAVVERIPYLAERHSTVLVLGLRAKGFGV